MSAIIRLNTEFTNANLPGVNEAITFGALVGETGAAGSYLLGADVANWRNDYSASGSNDLTEDPSVPSLFEGYATLSGYDNSADTGIALQTEMTLAAVFRVPDVTSGQSRGVLGGISTGTSADRFGIWVATNDVTVGNQANATATVDGLTANLWVCVVARRGAGGDRNIISFRSTQDSGELSASDAFTGSKTVHVGNSDLRVAGWDNPVDIAEAHVYTTALSGSEMAALYGRMRTRCARRGITIPALST